MNLFAIQIMIFVGLFPRRQTSYTNEWAIQIDGEEDIAKRVAKQHGFQYLGPILPGYHHLHHPEVPSWSSHPSSRHLAALLAHPEVTWAAQQVARPRPPRAIVLNDPLWPESWHLNGQGPLDMRVRQAWEMGYTGEGVVVTVIDDGLETDHPDLRASYDRSASYDVCDDDPDPTPRKNARWPLDLNPHGTRCAGEVAAAANNSVCGVGVAFRAGIGGVRLLDCKVTDAREAQSLSWNPQHVDIFTASWGPLDDGRTVDGPDKLAQEALLLGVRTGRQGKGSIFVWASGNGGQKGDACNADGYVNSPNTLTVSAVLRRGQVPVFAEPCAATLASALSSQQGDRQGIVTTNTRHRCTRTHTGTSASTPLVAGIVALTLQANPQLTWRDVQHLVVETANPEGLAADDWTRNGVGRKVSHYFGFGLMDAVAMVTEAKNWTTVPELHSCTIPGPRETLKIPQLYRVYSTVSTEACAGTREEVRFAEHVQVKVTLTTRRRGSVHVALVSPAGTRSTLLAWRPRDESREGLTAWTFSSARCWGEDPRGDWTLEVKTVSHSAVVKEWTLVVHGTSSPPRPGSQAREGRAATRASCVDCRSASTCLICGPRPSLAARPSPSSLSVAVSGVAVLLLLL